MFLVYSGNIWKQDILYCWGNASNKEEYRRASAIKQKTEGIRFHFLHGDFGHFGYGRYGYYGGYNMVDTTFAAPVTTTTITTTI